MSEDKSMQSKRQTLEQRRAKLAWEQIESVPESAQAKYGTFARRLPSMIQMNGLGSSMAFLLSKGKNKSQDGHMQLYHHVSDWVITQMDSRQNDLMSYIRECETDDYRRATTETIAYGIWLKRYVEAKDWGSDNNDE